MRVFLLLLLWGVYATGCSLSGEKGRQLVDFGIKTEQEYRDERARLIGALEDAIGEARATDASFCEVVEIGTKACGGPVEYRVYSSADGDPSRVLELARTITQLDAEANVAFGLASTCDVPIPPTPVLEGGRCMADDIRMSTP